MNVFGSTRNLKTRPWAVGALAVGFVLTVLPGLAVAQYDGAATCGQSGCHESKYGEWLTSGHQQILMPMEDAVNRSLPIPSGTSTDDYSYTVGGNKTKTLYLDDQGYIVTSGRDAQGRPVAGSNQFNLLTGEWDDYHAGEANLMYDCGECHTTGYDAGGNMPGLPGISGSFALPGVQCEHCHGGPGAMDPAPTSASFCGECHGTAPTSSIPASGGFISSEHQYNEFLAGAHASQSCVTCHNPHMSAEWGIKTQCSDCHSSKATAYENTVMYDAGVECIDCHMPYATLSAEPLGPFEGDMKTHIFRINTDPNAPMFSQDGNSVAMTNGEAAVTLDFVCQRCHGSSTKADLAPFAEDFHANLGNNQSIGSLANFGLDPGLSGTWWNTAKSGEGFLIDVAYAGPTKFLYVSLYAYGPNGEQTWLVAALTSEDGTTGNVNVYIPEGGTWGDPSTANTGQLWGTGSLSFPTCTSGHVTLTPNQAMIDRGYTTLDYDLVRYFTAGMACPTLAHNAQ